MVGIEWSEFLPPTPLPPSPDYEIRDMRYEIWDIGYEIWDMGYEI
jgi:hypothetical protein